MHQAGPRLAALSWLLLALLTAAVTVQAQPKPAAAPAVTARSLPAPSGVRSEAKTVLAAPAEEVATLLADPRNFVPLFPAHAVDVLTSAADLQVVAVEMRKPWPVGTVKWVEDVEKHRDADGKSFVVQRTAHPGYFKYMSARFHIAPDPAAATERCIVTYEVAMELKRWAPEWALRRGNLNGILDTMARLRTLVAERGKEPAAAHQ